MRIESPQEAQQLEHLFDHPFAEPLGSGKRHHITRRDPHGISSQDRFRTSSGTIRFQSLIHLQSRRLARTR